MKFLQSRTMHWWEVGLIKLAVLLIAIAIGAHWATFFKPYVKEFVVVGLIVGIVSLYLWLKKK